MLELEAACFSVPWTRKMLQDELTSDIAAYYGVRDGGVLVGYAGMQSIIDEGYVTNVAVDPAYRRRGIGDALMLALREHARSRGLSFLSLEVREGNAAARRLYRKHGFVESGFRKGYYRKPTEDAIIMTLVLE